MTRYCDIITLQIILSFYISDCFVNNYSFRIGGRVLTSRFGSQGGDIVEEGANWIHGGCGANSFFNLANQLGMLPGKLIQLDRFEQML